MYILIILNRKYNLSPILNSMQLASFPHADFRYDYDDPKPKRAVHLLQKKKTGEGKKNAWQRIWKWP
jgi:hypothetical protein